MEEYETVIRKEQKEVAKVMEKKRKELHISFERTFR